MQFANDSIMALAILPLTRFMQIGAEETRFCSPPAYACPVTPAWRLPHSRGHCRGLTRSCEV